MWCSASLGDSNTLHFPSYWETIFYCHYLVNCLKIILMIELFIGSGAEVASAPCPREPPTVSPNLTVLTSWNRLGICKLWPRTEWVAGAAVSEYWTPTGSPRIPSISISKSSPSIPPTRLSAGTPRSTGSVLPSTSTARCAARPHPAASRAVSARVIVIHRPSADPAPPPGAGETPCNSEGNVNSYNFIFILRNIFTNLIAIVFILIKLDLHYYCFYLSIEPFILFFFFFLSGLE